MIFLLLLSTGADARAPRGVMTSEGRKTLTERVFSQTYTIRRRLPQPKGVIVPGGGWVYARGWGASAGRVLTVASVVADWPQGPTDRLEVIDHKGRVHIAAVGLLESALGLAVLDVADLELPEGHSPPLLEMGAIYGGAALYGAGDGGLLGRYAVRGPASGAYAYYWEVDGKGMVGTPLMTMEGRLVSLIGVISNGKTDRSMALPTKALVALFSRTADWAP